MLAHLAQAQWNFVFEQTIEVRQEAQNLAFPWAGGLNSGQYYNIDLNRDGQQDLIIFDRSSNQFMPFISQNQTFEYAPEYSLSFPEGISNWVVFADYDGDGQQDLFTASGRRSITVYRNTSEDELSWELVADPLATIGFSGFEIAIQINPTDIPAISDIDGDGDLDIVVYNVNGRGNLEYYQNQSIENDDASGLAFEAVDNAWGGVAECNCGLFAFGGEACEGANNRMDNNQRQMHVGGKTLLALDVDGDGDQDILTSDEGCGSLYFMENVGSSQEAVFTSFSSNYPEEIPDDMPMSFPAAYYVDVTHDGIKDLLIAPNLNGEIAGSEDMRNSSWLYENIGTEEQPEFVLRQHNFLQSEMIEVGENAAPVLVDYDADGDLDLFIAHIGSEQPDGYYGGIYLYENTGTASEPMYEYMTSDYLNLNQWNLQQLQLYFEDIDGDGLPDLLLGGAENAYASRAVFYGLINQAANAQLPWQFEPSQRQTLNLDFAPDDQLAFVNGSLDVLVAKAEGNLEYYQNLGERDLPLWELMTEEAGGISGGINERNLSVFLYDFDRDGKEDLLSANASGHLFVYSDFLSQLEEMAIADTVLTSINQQRTKLRVDNRVSMFAAQLDESGKTYVMVGSPQGGIRLFSHNIDQDVGDIALMVYPNPTLLTEPEVKVRAAAPIRWLQMISMNGAILAEFEASHEHMQEMDINVAGLASGIYLIRAWDHAGNVSAGKLMVR